MVAAAADANVGRAGGRADSALGTEAGWAPGLHEFAGGRCRRGWPAAAAQRTREVRVIPGDNRFGRLNRSRRRHCATVRNGCLEVGPDCELAALPVAIACGLWRGFRNCRRL